MAGKLRPGPVYVARAHNKVQQKGQVYSSSTYISIGVVWAGESCGHGLDERSQLAGTGHDHMGIGENINRWPVRSYRQAALFCASESRPGFTSDPRD